MTLQNQDRTSRYATAAILALLVHSGAAAQSAEGGRQLEDLDILAELSLEELMSVKVTSVAGHAQDWFRTPAAMYVITGDDIRRSGHRTLAEALRLAPGVFVGQTDSNSWSVGMRGFNGGLANKSLILIDGRSVYDPLFSGTFWDVQDTLLEDVDRIEVIRGPGATLWGANAVNGVINITTKSAAQTQGLYLNGGGGTLHQGFGAVRYGARVGDNAWLRVWTKYDLRDSFERADGTSAGDDWDMWRGGFRFDMAGSDDLSLTLQGDLYHSDRIGEGAVEGRAAGGNLLVRVARDSPDGSGWSLRGYYDRTERFAAASGLDVDRDTLDADFRQRFRLGASHQLMWGLELRHTSDETLGGGVLTLDPEKRDSSTYSAFVQDTITLVPDRLFAMIGSKVEHNDYTGFEFQPSGRLWWTPDDHQTIWGSISRTVRLPSRLESDVVGVLRGDANLRAEEIFAYEAGYRRRLSPRLTIDLAGFHNQYNDLIFVGPTSPLTFNNDGSAEVYGSEVAVTWQAAQNWRLDASYSLAQVFVHGPIVNSDEGSTPHHMVRLQSYLDITDEVEFNAGVSYVDAVPAQTVDAYWRLDLGLVWRVTDSFEVSVWGQNLLENSHEEFSSIEVPRAVYAMGSIRF